ncbi:MAG: 4-hydroxythreonine-4-phosphate dehydrogenase PdxA [Vicinamibacterales bacterium]|jgi:4-hydroxythreonine-4-phosphate dehydrogenase|nr:4-hydroxythreonine-4-phosphate dehydrogenase PdxA [Acidobacteriota bacterium]MDP7294546.1 4-hydroxythreonine-4-phosphate dehydrogenase PdxA [Vicinamibacterales bacterium]MDP7477681.1 4-hydroxythreonine-4-phosphate dehydrogenase PdxA [Vicinamibacterales bacterium]MDP7671495.1 4-hydroxythreonine-4-phosphate dehydrogenase PdxA [Vicinamibacterales bacterium]HJO39426.1 4-hydroxythreonine-4-phosphate dehydrogenase PdxA [Vicinamibacterales bacterium]|tara:strand:- start:1021 stop:1941 length:921 start_codon:yes stop_codon:yes gene_type:complete
MTTSARPRIAVTVGDPAGIGPEVSLKAADDSRVREVAEVTIHGPTTTEELEPFAPGVVSAEAGRSAYETIERAVAEVQAGRADALVTAPINKEAFAAAGLQWRGHTELLAHLTGADDVAMMFHSDKLRVVLATVHVPLAEVPRLLTAERVKRTIRLAASELPRFGVPEPRLAMAGLNPHAGEHGLLGSEDGEVIAPAVEACRAAGIDVVGPLPADTLFVSAIKGRYDAVVACYHDQGLIPAKLAAFGKTVNVTLGLPIIRTSVDHGTAFDIARQGVADPSSMVEAVLLAVRLAAGRRGDRAERVDR